LYTLDKYIILKKAEKLNIVYLKVAIILTDNPLPFSFLEISNKYAKNKAQKTIENKYKVSKD